MSGILSFEQIIAQVKESVACVDVHTLKQELDSGKRLYLIDVREDREWRVANIPGAIHMSRGVLEKKIKQVVFEPDAPVYLVCRGGHRSVLAAKSLMQMGYERVYSVNGGISEWAMFGYPIEEQEVAKV